MQLFVVFQDDETQATVHVPRVLPKNEDPSLVDRNKRMLGRMLGTLAVLCFNALTL